MFKFITKIFISISLFFSIYANASLITDSSLLNADYYVTYSDANVTIDFAWASPVNVEFWGDPNEQDTNRLTTPFENHLEWDYATQSDLDILFANFTSTDFYDPTNNINKSAVQFWNTVFDDIVTKFMVGTIEIIDRSNIENFDNKQISSRWVSSGVDGQDVNGSEYDTFYVRKTFNNPDNNVSVPEPATLLIFSFALIALSLRNRFIK